MSGLHRADRVRSQCGRGPRVTLLPRARAKDGPAARGQGCFRALLILMALVAQGCALPHPTSREPRILRDCPICGSMRVIPPGHFLMGSPGNEPGRQANEAPRHSVLIARAFAIGVHDVTVAEYRRFVEATGYAPGNPRCDWRNPTVHGIPISQMPEDPVVCVSWNDAHAYLQWLSQISQQPYRLPTEAEWEYAARAGSTAARPWGPDPDSNYANTGTETCCGPRVSKGDRWPYTSPVGSFPPNAFGLFDMIGDVWQWTMNCGSADYTQPDTPDLDATSCRTHVVRGGGWFHPPQVARSAARAADDSELRMPDIGFRVARSVP